MIPLSRKAVEEIEDVLEPLGLKMSHGRLLMILCADGRISWSAAEKMFLTSRSFARIVEELRGKGFVSVGQPDPGSERVIEATDEGEELALRLCKIAAGNR